MTTTDNMNLIQRAALSDLFFNHTHTELEAAYAAASSGARTGGLDLDDVREAVAKDAEQFVEIVDSLGIEVTVDEMVNDYMSRI